MDSGATIGMDRFGMEHVLSDAQRAATVLALLSLGYADRMILSHDAAVFSHVTPPSWRASKAPNWHMENISRRILPMLRDGGASEHDLEQMLVTNPDGSWSRSRRDDRADWPTPRSWGSATVKAALLVEPGRMVVDDVPEPEPGPDDVLIAVGGVGLCGSDLSVFRGTWTLELSMDPGHEAFGTIEAVGERVPTARIGETVVLEPNIVCGTCTQCRRGWTSACLRRQSVGMNRQGAIAERIVVPTTNAWRVEPAAPEQLVCSNPLRSSRPPCVGFRHRSRMPLS